MAYDEKKAKQQWRNKVNNAQGHIFDREREKAWEGVDAPVGSSEWNTAAGKIDTINNICEAVCKLKLPVRKKQYRLQMIPSAVLRTMLVWEAMVVLSACLPRRIFAVFIPIVTRNLTIARRCERDYLQEKGTMLCSECAWNRRANGG